LEERLAVVVSWITTVLVVLQAAKLPIATREAAQRRYWMDVFIIQFVCSYRETLRVA
jgi:hypothetical protein